MPIVIEDIQHKNSRTVVSLYVMNIQAVSVGTAPRLQCTVYVSADVLDFAVLHLHSVLIDLEIHQKITVGTAFYNQVWRMSNI